jgi:uncharacterized membrane protein
MSARGSELELIMILYNDPQRARGAFEVLRTSQKTGELRLVDAAEMHKDLQGIADFQELHDVKAWRGTLFGAAAGAVLGLLGGAAGAVVGAAIGAAAGGAVAGSMDLGFSNKFLSELKREMRPGYSALLVLVDPPWEETLLKVVEPFMGLIYRHLLREDVVQALRGASAQE